MANTAPQNRSTRFKQLQYAALFSSLSEKDELRLAEFDK